LTFRTDGTTLRAENNELRQETESLQQYTRRNNAVTGGIPYQENEDLFQLIQKCAGSIGVKIEPQDIDIAHRLPTR